jgi:hypothetical protein
MFLKEIESKYFIIIKLNEENFSKHNLLFFLMKKKNILNYK